MINDDMPASMMLDPVEGQPRAWFEFYPPNVDKVIQAPPLASIPAMVSRAAEQYADRTAFSNFGSSLTFREVDELATQFAAFLQHDLGMQRGDRIALQMPNIMQYPVALFGAQRAGMIVVNANPLYTVSEMREVFADADPVAIVVLANFAEKVAEVLPDTNIRHTIVTQVGDLLSQPKGTIMNLAAKYLKKMVPAYSLPNEIRFNDALRAGRGRSVTDPQLTTDDTAFLQYTGGTTGGTKAAILTHGNMLANQAQFIGQMRAALGDGASTVVAALPLYHVFSLTVNCIGFFLFGGHNVLITNPRDVPAFVKTLARTKPNALIVVSTLAGALLDSEDFAQLDLSELKITVAGGMALRSSVAERWKKQTGQDIIEGYGLTEASPVVTVNPVHLPPRLGTIGVPLPSTDVKVVDDDRNEVAHGEPGELAVRGPQVMRGYWQQPEETSKVLTDDGWLLTGDIATIDDDGYVTIVDRKKEIILVSGFNVYPGELEDAAMQHSKVSEAGAIAVDDEKAGEVPKLFVVRRDASLTESELVEFLRTRLAGYKRPRYIAFRDELPKTNVGKVLRRALKESDAD